ncbi:hypothetical protein [Lentzea sp. NPDC059081]|uniref:hypothetical protein n=1 Tax=Lentzea sp. NPDC059081 TaxID=3346719 RepID=UPI00367CCC9D
MKSVGEADPEPVSVEGSRDELSLTKWHLDRYDRLRASTATRASVVMSAGALLSAGNAVVLTHLLSVPAGRFSAWLLICFTIGLAGSACLVVMSLIRAAGVLVTIKDSRTMFASQQQLPPSFLFNGPYTVEHFGAFEDFWSHSRAQNLDDILQAAHVELWLVIKQHRHRYQKLREAVRRLRWAAIAFLVVLLGLLLGFVTRL